MIQTERGPALLCSWCGNPCVIPPGANVPPLDVTCCGGCGKAVQVPFHPTSAHWLERVEDESKLPLRVTNKLAELRGNLRHRGVIH